MRNKAIELGCRGEPELPPTVNCSEIFARPEPPMDPMGTLFRDSDRSSSRIARGVLYATTDKRTSPTRNRYPDRIYLYPASAKVPSTSNRTGSLIDLSAKVLAVILDETMMAKARKRATSDRW